ncbi:stage IV sporulation protein A [uncultured Merdimonas sp.]|uniref:stage IV sporulation protein A n=1 Tax=uncultured Merdimonas sp. TaxID=2023269 RepID=UPI0032091F63
MNTDQLYRDIQTRTGGEIYLGVVGPVRTGKSTFIKRFMDVLVLPQIEDEARRLRDTDELPQSASGKTIMTTEPKFVPKDAARIRLSGEGEVRIRLIDCVGFMVDGASGHIEGGKERQVKTPWSDREIPFSKAAEIGTKKVICDHATIGIVITTDGSITEIPRENYLPAEKKTIQELKQIGKPFVILVNSRKPDGEAAKRTAEELEKQYQTRTLPVNCEQLSGEDIHRILEAVLLEFPVAEVEFYLPGWVEVLPLEHKIKQEILTKAREIMKKLNQMGDVSSLDLSMQEDAVAGIVSDHLELDTGKVGFRVKVPDQYYYKMLSEMTGVEIRGQYGLITVLKELAKAKEEYGEIKDAFLAVKGKGYGAVSPGREDILLDEPTVIRQGNKYGVKIRSQAPSIHLIRANIETEIAPIVGTEQQALDLIRYLKDAGDGPEGIWKTNIFGKSIEELVMDGMKSKLAMINEASQEKLQDTMQKIVNDSNGGLVCIII